MRHLGRWMALCVCVMVAGQAFSVCPPPAGPNIVFPADNATNQSRNITLQWSAVAGATSYDILFGPVGACSGSPSFTTTNTQFNPPPLPADETYEWKVLALGTGCPTPPASACVSFHTAPCPAASTNNSPANNTVVPFGNVTFTWAAVANTTTYELYLGLDGDTPSPLGFTNLTSKTLFIEPGRTVEWFVKTHADGCDGEESSPTTFTTTCPTNPPSAVSPLRNATFAEHQNITFNWTNVAGAVSYDVKLSDDGGDSYEILAENIPNNSYSTDDLTRGAYLWEIRANFDSSCDPLYSEPRELIVGLDCSSSTAVELEAPPPNATLANPVTFRWTGRANAEEYQLFVHRTGSNVRRMLTETRDTEYTTSELEAGTWEWNVVTVFDECPDASSAGRILTIDEPVHECPEAAIGLLTPAEGAATTSPVRVSWTPVANTTFYRVWISLDGGAPVNLARTNATEASLRLPNGAITWYVDAQREECDAVVSPEGHFTVARAANCENNPLPQLVSPLGTRQNPAAVNNPPTLVWGAVPNAIGYRVWISHDLLSFEDVALTLETHLQLDVLEPGTHAWFVQALFEGCPPTAAAPAFFRVGETGPRCPTGKPNIVSPAEGSQAASPVTFVWTAVEGATKYRVFASIDESEIKLLGSTDDTELTRTLPPGHVVWAVEAVFDECPSTLSNRVAFTIPRSQNCPDDPAQLIAPANGATNVASPLDFVWAPVSGALKYVVFAQANDGAPTAIGATNDTHLFHAMPPGVIRWWVLTFFSGCDPLESEHARFTVARNAACDNRRPILLLPEDRTQSPIGFQWTAVPRAQGYRVWARLINEGTDVVIASTTEPFATVQLQEGTYEYFVEAQFDGCPSTESARAEFVVTPPVPCGKPRRPEAQVIGQALSETRYRVRWTPLPNVKFYEVQEATSFDFSTAPTLTTTENSMPFSHAVTGAPVQYLYRIRGVSDCSNDRGPYSEVVGVFIIAPKTNNASTEIGSEDHVIQKLFLPGSTSVLQFTATTDKPWLTVAPSNGTLPLEGTTLTVTADPSFLSLGTNTGTIQIQYSGGSAAKGVQTHANTISTVPLSVSLVTPVLPTGKGTPPPDSLIFAVVGHATGINDSLFESDIRVTNLTAQTMKYQLNFTPSGVDGTQTGSSSNIEIAPNATMALDDIVASLFGTGTTSSATGMLEVRPLTTSSNATTGFFGSTGAASTVRALATAASSRTYNFTPNGTFGQFIPATRFADFVGKAAAGLQPTILSLQQVAQSAAFRANFGFAEAAGSSADLTVRVYDIANNLLKTIPVSLQPSEHKQINGMLAANGITNLTDGRVEVEVTGGNGKVTAYVSEVDNVTNDPLLVSAVVKGGVTANKYVVPGVAYLNNPQAFWVTDLRVFNAGPQTQATLTFYPQNNPSAAIAKEITLLPGEIEVLDNVLGTLFEQSGNAGGSVAVTTTGNSQLTATARTYNKTTTGTYGQYIAGVTPAESVGVTDRALQLLQLEQSSRFRTNIGLDETNGQSARVEVTAIVPDLIVSPVVTFDLQPNEFRQFSLAEFGIGNAVYNARVTVKVISGNGRVTTYGSVIDAITQDPTYVPAQ